MASVQNHSTVPRFILLGLTDRADQKELLFATFLLIYLVTLVGNLGLIDVIWASTSLHTPMYFLLGVLSFLDVCSSSLFTPRLLISLLTTDQSISFEGCVVQMALMTLHGSGECVLLSIMACDRFVAICHPLLYHSIMSKRLCVQLVGLTYAAGYSSQQCRQGMSSAHHTVAQTSLTITPVTSPLCSIWPAQTPLWPMSSCSSFPP